MGCCKVCCYFDLVASLFQLRLREIVGNSGKEINGDQSGDDGKVCLQSYAEFREVGSRTQTALDPCALGPNISQKPREPMVGIEPTTTVLPRLCATTAPHGPVKSRKKGGQWRIRTSEALATD